MARRLLGTITITAGTSKNNHSTAVPFGIPYGARAIEMVTTASDVKIKILPDRASWNPLNPAAYVPPFSPASTVAATSADYSLSANTFHREELGSFGAPSILACYSVGGASVAVYLSE